MIKPPGADFYGAIAALIPFLLRASADARLGHPCLPSEPGLPR